MSHYRPKIEKEKKTPSVSRVLLIGVWVVWVLLVLLDLYRAFFLSGITANDIFWDQNSYEGEFLWNTYA